MGGEIENTNKKISNNDEVLWDAILTLTKERVDEFPFTAREVVIKIGKEKSATMITRERGGLQTMLHHKIEKFLKEVRKLVEEEKHNTGEISWSFCRKLGLLITTHDELFAIDIIRHSHRNSEMLFEEIKEFIDGRSYIYFGSGFYVLLMKWYEDGGFTRESVVGKYESQIRALFLKYQLTRPDMSVAVGRAG